MKEVGWDGSLLPSRSVPSLEARPKRPIPHLGSSLVTLHAPFIRYETSDERSEE